MGMFTSQPPSPPKPLIRDFDLIRCIGQGSFGDVWLSRSVTGLYRAIKIIYRARFRDTRPFERELQAIRKYDPVSRSNESLVDVLYVGVDEAEGFFYYVMELADDLCSGPDITPETYKPKTLSAVLHQQSRLPFDESLALGITLTKGLAFLHKKGLVHRDIKPSNIIYVGGSPKLADIGSVAALEDPKSLAGTQGFIPPEGHGTAQADIFSLGKTLYEAALGLDRTEFPGLPDEINEWADGDKLQEFNEILLKACHNDFRKRYQSAEEMASDLITLLDGRSIRQLRAVQRRYEKLRKGVIVGVGVIALLGLVAFEIIRERNRKQDIDSREMGRHLEGALQKMDRGDLVQALPSLVSAAKLDWQKREELNRIRIISTLAQTPKIIGLYYDPYDIQDLGVSADGRFILSATYDDAIVRDATTGAQIGNRFRPPAGVISGAAFHPEGNEVFITTTTPTATAWDWRTGTLLYSLPHQAQLMSVSYNHGGDRLLITAKDGVARIWDRTPKSRGPRLQHHTKGLRFACYSPDDQWILTCGEDGLAALWSVTNTNNPVHRLVHGPLSWVMYGAFSPDSKYVITGCSDKNAYVWEVESGRKIMPGLLHNDGVSCVAFSPDGLLIATGSWDNSVRLWVASSGVPFLPNPVLPHSHKLSRVNFAPDGHRLVTSCNDGTTWIWDLAGAMAVSEKKPGILCEDGTRLLITNDEHFDVINLRNGKTNTLQKPPGIFDAALSQNGRFILGITQPSTNGPHRLQIWDADSGKTVCEFSKCSNSLSSMIVNDDATQLLAWKGGTLRMFDTKSGALLSTSIPLPKPIHKALVSPRGQYIMALAESKAAVFQRGQPEASFVFHQSNRVVHAAFSADERYAVTACSDDDFTRCDAQVWNLSTGKPHGPPIKHKDGVLNACFSPSGDAVVTAGEDSVAIVTPLLAGRPVHHFQHHYQVRRACFSVFKRWLLTTSRDETARIWDLASGEPLTPPLYHTADLANGTFLETNRIVTAGKREGCWTWEIPTEVLPEDDLQSTVNLLNGEVAVPKGAKVEAAEQMATEWNRLKTKYPHHFVTSSQEIRAWHEKLLTLARKENNRAAQDFHEEKLKLLQ